MHKKLTRMKAWQDRSLQYLGAVVVADAAHKLARNVA
jgi:hypothetical protein